MGSSLRRGRVKIASELPAQSSSLWLSQENNCSHGMIVILLYYDKYK